MTLNDDDSKIYNDRGEEVEFPWKRSEGGIVNGPGGLPKKKHRIVMSKGEWVMNKKTIQDKINEKFNG